MNMIIGIATGLWICSPKTWESWSNFLCCCFFNKKGKEKFYNGISEYVVDAVPSAYGTTENVTPQRYSVNALQNAHQQQNQQYLLTRPLIPQQPHYVLNKNSGKTTNLNSVKAYHNGQTAPPPSSNSEFVYGKFYTGRGGYESQINSNTTKTSLLPQPKQKKY